LSDISSFQKSKTLLLSAGHLVNDSYNGFLAPILPLLMHKYNLSLTLTASLATILAVTSSLMQPLQGYLADKWSHRWLVAIGPLLTAIFMSFIGIAPNFWVLAIFLLLSGVGTSTFHPPAATMVARCSGGKRGLGMSIFVTSGSLGVALGPVIILAVVKFWGLNFSVLTIFPGLIIALLLFLYAPALPRPVVFSKQVRSPLVFSTSNWIFILLLTFIAILRAITFVGFCNFSPLFLTQQGLSTELAGLSVTFMLVFGGLGAFLGGIISDFMGRRRLLFFSLLLAIPSALGYIYFSGFMRFVGLALAGFCLSASLPVTIIMAQELVPQRSSTVSSLMMGFCWGIAGFMLTPLGALADRMGLENVLWGLSWVPLLALFLLWPLRSGSRSSGSFSSSV